MADSKQVDPIINDPAVLTEVSAAFEAYDAALLSHDVAALGDWFWPSEHTVRYGLGEELHGAGEIAAYRHRQTGPIVRGPLRHKAITTFGSDAASVVIEFDDRPGRRGRQLQSWIRFAGGWRIVAAHVSARDL